MDIQRWRQEQGPLASHFTTSPASSSGKSYPLFSMLFGMGLVLMYDRQGQRSSLRPSISAGSRSCSSSAWHAFLLWYGDILIYYACFGVVVMWHDSNRAMLIIASALVVVSAIWASGLGYLFAKLGENADKPAQVQVEGFEGFRTALFEGKIRTDPRTSLGPPPRNRRHQARPIHQCRHHAPSTGHRAPSSGCSSTRSFSTFPRCSCWAARSCDRA